MKLLLKELEGNEWCLLLRLCGETSIKAFTCVVKLPNVLANTILGDGQVWCCYNFPNIF